MSKEVNILVTGANGQLGMEVQKLSSEVSGFKFTFTDKSTLDISDEKAVLQLFSNNKFHFLINCAAFTHVDNAEKMQDSVEKVNITGVRNLSKACKKSGTIFIQISSDYVYNSKSDVVFSEVSVCDPIGVYAKSKYAGEKIIQDITSAFIILRTSWVYSSFGHNFVKTMLRVGKIREKVSVVSDQIGSPTYAADLANVIIQIISKISKNTDSKPYFGIYNYSNLGFISWAEFAEEIFNIAKMNVMVEAIPSSEYKSLAERPMNSRMSKSKIADTFHINLSHWKKSLQKCIQEIDNSIGS